MTRVSELIPGDLIGNGDMKATYIAQAEHPLWPSLRLVIWHMPDGTRSLDALSASQDVGERLSRNEPPGRRETRLRGALLDGEMP